MEIFVASVMAEGLESNGTILHCMVNVVTEITKPSCHLLNMKVFYEYVV